MLFDDIDTGYNEAKNSRQASREKKQSKQHNLQVRKQTAHAVKQSLLSCMIPTITYHQWHRYVIRDSGTQETYAKLEKSGKWFKIPDTFKTVITPNRFWYSLNRDNKNRSETCSNIQQISKLLQISARSFWCSSVLFLQPVNKNLDEKDVVKRVKIRRLRKQRTNKQKPRFLF